MTTIGRFRHRLTLEAPDEAPDGAGGVVRAWTSLGQVWAAIEPLSMGDTTIADKHLGRLTHRIVVRRRDELTLNHRFRLGQRTFAIQAMRDEDKQGHYLACLTVEERP